jgi:hypothetical protein
MDLNPPKHYHLVQMPGDEEKHRVPCGLPDTACPFGNASPRLLGDWLRYESLEGPRAMSFEAYLEKATKKDPEMDAIVEGIQRLAGEGKTVPFVKHNEDGSSTTIGYAAVKVEGGVISADITLDAHLLFGQELRRGLIDAHSISIGGGNPVERFVGEYMADNLIRPEDIKPFKVSVLSECENPHCSNLRSHQHGPACTEDCDCNRHGRVD